MRYAARRDDNDADLRALAEKLEVWLTPTTHPVDYLAFHQGRWSLVEIKDPKKQGHADEFTAKQLKFREEAARYGAPVHTWRTQADVLKFVEGRC